MSSAPPWLRRAPVTHILIAICAVVWLGEVLVPGLIDELSLPPHLALSEPWRWVTSAFTHDDFLPVHIAFNMLALWMVGRGMEAFLGRWRFLTIYALSALAGGVAYVLSAFPPSAAHPDGLRWTTGLVGASGAVFGLFGALLIAQRHLGQDTRQLWVVLAINGVISFTIPHVAWQAHIGGFMAGLAAMAVLLRGRPRPGQPWPSRKPPPAWPGLVGIAVLLVAAVAVKYATL